MTSSRRPRHLPPASGRASTAGRAAVLAGLVAAIALAGLLMFGSSGRYGVLATFQNAGQLVVGNQVQVGGAPVGEITAIRLTRDGRAEVEMELDDELAPLHQGTTARIRATSLSGIANRYVSLDPGPNTAPEIADGGRIGADDATAPVDLDQLFNTLDPGTRAGLQRLVRGFGAQYDGKGDEANESARYFSPALSTGARLARELARDRQAFEDLVRDSSDVVSALAERRGELSSLVRDAGTTARAVGDENEALARALGMLPGTVRKANTTFVNLRATVDDLEELVEASKPAARDLEPFLRRLRPLVAGAEPTIRDLRLLVRRSGEGNDLTELVRKAPRLADLAETTWPRTIDALRTAQPVLEYARPYVPDLTAWFTKFGQGANAYDANGHYARIQPIFNAFSLADSPSGGLLNAAPPSQRLDGFETRKSQRCPGGAVQPAPDGSSPWRPAAGFDCDPGATPPAP